MAGYKQGGKSHKSGAGYTEMESPKMSTHGNGGHHRDGGGHHGVAHDVRHADASLDKQSQYGRGHQSTGPRPK